MTHIRVHLFFLLFVLVWCWTPPVSFSIQLYSSGLRFLFDSSKHFLQLLKFLFCPHIVFLNLLCIFMMVTLNSLSGNSYIYNSLGSISGVFSCSFFWTVFPHIFIFLDSLSWHLHNRRKPHTFPVFMDWPHIKEVLYPSPKPELLWSPQTIMLVQTTIFVLGGPQASRVCWVLSVHQYRQDRSHSLKQHLEKPQCRHLVSFPPDQMVLC